MIRSWYTRLDAFTIDEPWHIVAGTTYAREGDFGLNPEHPPLVKLWVGAAMPDDFRVPPRPALSEKTQERTWVEKTMFFGNDAAAAQRHARRAMWGFHAVLLLALGLLLWRAFGLAWAAGSLAFIGLGWAANQERKGLAEASRIGAQDGTDRRRAPRRPERKSRRDEDADVEDGILDRR